MELVSVGFIITLVGLTLYNSYDKVSDWTATGYYKLTGRRVAYLALIKFYGITAILLIVVGIILG